MTNAILPMLPNRDQPVARQGERIISRATFVAHIEELAGQLPDQPYVVNFCADRYRFTVAWAAAMLRGQVTLLPSGRDPNAVAALHAEYPALYVLTDDGNDYAGPGLHFAYPALCPTGSASGVPAFPPDRIAAVLFTSGSTGQPHPVPRRWGRLVAASLAAGAALGIGRFAGSALVATVPHAHSYGLESAVMLPLQHGLLLTAERPFFPADVVALLDKDYLPGILVTTPVHLRSLVTGAEGPCVDSVLRAGFVLSATAPLSGELAEQAEAAFGAPVLEIYGCSEAGQLATRRTVDGPVWRCLDGFRVYSNPAGCWASGPDEADILLADRIEPVSSGGFILQGRTADLVNVAGKRSSLAFLTQQLLAVEGVQDGVFLLPEDNSADLVNRLIAVAVAPGLTPATILDRLRGRIDDAFLPRPLHMVAALPRNDLGKLAHSDVLRLSEPLAVCARIDPKQASAAWTSDHPSVGQATTLCLAGIMPAAPTPVRLCFPLDHPAASGHFPGDPIIPGAVLLDEVVAALFPAGCSGRLETAKFHQPVRPGDTVTASCTLAGALTRFECRHADNGQLVLSGALQATTSSPALPSPAIASPTTPSPKLASK